MKLLEPFFISVIRELISSNVSFLLIGGYAVNYYGYGRYTGDIDFWIKPDNDNKFLLLDVFRKLKWNKEDIAEIEKLDFTNTQVISIGEPPIRIDFITHVNLVDYNEAWNKRQMWPLENFKVPIVDYHHLILTKFNTGRTKDKLDIEELQKIKSIEKK